MFCLHRLTSDDDGQSLAGDLRCSSPVATQAKGQAIMATRKTHKKPQLRDLPASDKRDTPVKGGLTLQAQEPRTAAGDGRPTEELAFYYDKIPF
jgi:hypothetical protein